MLDNGEFDCNFTSDFTTFMSSTTEIYQTSLAYTTSTSYAIDEFSSTVGTETDTKSTASITMDYETTEMTTAVSSTISNISITTESILEATSSNTNYWTMESTSDVPEMLGPGSTKLTESETTSTVASETISSVMPETMTMSSTTTVFPYRSTTDYNPIVTDTTLSNSFFTDYPMVKTINESSADDQRTTTTIKTTTEYVASTPTVGSEPINTTAVVPESQACSNIMCQNGGSCVSTLLEGAKVSVIHFLNG